MQFIVIEGLDGSGKTTQIKLVEDFLLENNVKSKFIHFPRTESPIWGELISRFLRGDMGNINTVDPYLVALLYAGDRHDACELLNNWMHDGYVIIADRYLYSNIAFQCAKISGWQEKEKLAAWIKHFEYGYNKIPIPSLNLFLKVPFTFTEKSLSRRRYGNDRAYLNGAEDIHEADLSFQERVREVYLWQVDKNADFEAVDCSDGAGGMLPPKEISTLIIDKIRTKLQV